MQHLTHGLDIYSHGNADPRSKPHSLVLGFSNHAVRCGEVRMIIEIITIMTITIIIIT